MKSDTAKAALTPERAMPATPPLGWVFGGQWRLSISL